MKKAKVVRPPHQQDQISRGDISLGDSPDGLLFVLVDRIDPRNIDQPQIQAERLLSFTLEKHARNTDIQEGRGMGGPIHDLFANFTKALDGLVIAQACRVLPQVPKIVGRASIANGGGGRRFTQPLPAPQYFGNSGQRLLANAEQIKNQRCLANLSRAVDHYGNVLRAGEIPDQLRVHLGDEAVIGVLGPIVALAKLFQPDISHGLEP